MSTSFSSMSDSQLRAHYFALAKIVEAQSECVSYCSVESTNLALIREILNQRTSEAAARALTARTPESSARRGPSVSPYLAGPRPASGSIERRGVSTLSASDARLDGASGFSSPPKTARGPALSTLDELPDLGLSEAPGSSAVVVYAEHVSSPAMAGVLPSLAAISTAPATPLSADLSHSAFIRAVSSGASTPAHSILSKAMSDLALDHLISGASSVVSFEEPEPRRRRSLIAEYARSYRGSPVPDVVTEQSLAEEAERLRRESERYALPPGVNLLNPPADPSKDPLFTVYFRGSLAGPR
jgi:hypothetical protein